MNIRDLIFYYFLFNEHLGNEESELCTEEFGKWAFGDDYNIYTTPNWMELWNERHQHHLKLNPNGRPVDDIVLMIEAWKYYKNYYGKFENVQLSPPERIDLHSEKYDD